MQNDSKFCCMSTLETKLFSASLLDEVCWCDVNERTCVPFASAVINNNNNLIQRLYLRFFFTVSSQRCELSPARTLKWPGRNRVQIMCNTSSGYHMQVSCYVPLGMRGQLSYSV